jgi:hypothetical protein
MDAVRPSGPQRVLMREGVLAQRADQGGGLGNQQVRRPGKLERERRVEQVGGCHAEMDVGGGLAWGGVIGPRGQERDHVVAGDGFERGNGLWRWRRRRPHRADAACRDRSRRRMRFQDEGLDLPPQVVLVRVTPDAAHLWQRVPVDHVVYPAVTPHLAGPVAARRGRTGAIRPGVTAPASRPGVTAPDPPRCPCGTSRRAS